MIEFNQVRGKERERKLVSWGDWSPLDGWFTPSHVYFMRIYVCGYIHTHIQTYKYWSIVWLEADDTV